MNQEKDNRIPFDWELYQKGYEAVYRNGKTSGDVHDSFDNAIKCKRIGADCIGTYKLVRVDEK